MSLLLGVRTNAKTLYLYKLSQSVNNGWDTYDSAVVCACDEAAARRIHPNGYETMEIEVEKYPSWCSLKDVKVEFIGTTTDRMAEGVVVASFNAG